MKLQWTLNNDNNIDNDNNNHDDDGDDDDDDDLRYATIFSSSQGVLGLTGLKLENYYFFTFSFSRLEVGKLFRIYFFTFSRTEVGKL